MNYKWKPSKAQKRAFAEKMKDPAEQAAYEDRKRLKAEHRRAGSQFDYESAGGRYTPTQAQYEFCMQNMSKFVIGIEKDAANQVMGGHVCNQSVHHDYIHIVNEKMRNIC